MAIANAGFKLFRNYNLDITYGLPTAILTPTFTSDPSRQSFASADGTIELEIAVLRGRTIEALYRKLVSKTRRTIEYEKVTPEWFVITGSDPGREFYVRYHADRGAIRGFSISYPPVVGETLGPIIVAMSNVFRPSATASDPVVAFADTVTSTVDRVAMKPSAEDWDDCSAAVSTAAISACSRIIAIGDTDENIASAYFNRGLAYYDAGQQDSAFDDFTETIRLSPLDSEAYYYRGLALVRLQQTVRAIADFTEAIRIKPDYIEAYFNRGLAFVLELRQYDPAVADFDRAIALMPTHTLAYYVRGIAYEEKGELGRALSDFQHAVSSSKPDDPWYDDAVLRADEIETKLASQSPVPAPPSVATDDHSDCTEQSFGGRGDGITVHLTCRTIDGRETAVVRLSGDIEPGDDRYFRQALLAADSDNVLVTLESDGGNLDAGIEIGRAIWFREAATVVEEGICASACALAWLAGRPRYMAPKARIGFHAPWHGDPDRPEASTGGSAVVGGYLRDLGLTSAAIEYINEPGPDEMRWLTLADADMLNISVRPWQGQEAPPVAVVPPPAEVVPVAAGSTFRDCEACPEMVVVPAGSFTMGSSESETGHQADENPAHEVRLGAPFAVGRFEVTFAEWDACLADGGCDGYRPDDQHWGRGERPVVDVSWDAANDYTEWLSRKTGRPYRLLSEAEWEYAARAGTTTPYSFGATLANDQANFAAEKTREVGSFPASSFGLSDMHGNVWEWVADCYADSYRDAPADGTAVDPAGCEWRVVRGGGWNTTTAENMRTAFRLRRVPGASRDNVGFRVTRPLGETTEMGKEAP